MTEETDGRAEAPPLRVLTLDGGGAKGFYTLGVLKEIERRGIYADVKIGPADDASAGALTFTHLQASYAEKGEKKKSHYYLAKYRGRLLKIRITAINAVEDEIIGRVDPATRLAHLGDHPRFASVAGRRK
eukprot:gene42572-57627_t